MILTRVRRTQQQVDQNSILTRVRRTQQQTDQNDFNPSRMDPAAVGPESASAAGRLFFALILQSLLTGRENLLYTSVVIVFFLPVYCSIHLQQSDDSVKCYHLFVSYICSTVSIPDVSGESGGGGGGGGG